jgi:enamine deaminase RidA (YjgF/YER057c/UK114 family)
MSFETRLAELGLSLPITPKPMANYVTAVATGKLVYSSGQTPTVNGKLTIQGKLGRDVSLEQGQQAARVAVLNCLAAIRSVTGSLDEIARIVKMTGYVASAEGFNAQPQVINGASLLLEEIFGETGKHARAALGLAELPGGAPVEVELIVEVR